MKVLITSGTRVGGIHKEKDVEYDIPKDDALTLISLGKAKAVEKTDLDNEQVQKAGDAAKAAKPASKKKG